uniref:deubiquitinase OTUD6B-like isoform X3 n=2 Tax=Myxine glutinosa TaxID=7769 RepID=UPI00358F9DB6
MMGVVLPSHDDLTLGFQDDATYGSWWWVLCSSWTGEARVQAMKNVVPKNDKKRRKQLIEEVAALESQLEASHEEERQALSVRLGDCQSQVSTVVDGLQHLAVTSDASAVKSTVKVSKAQRRRDKKECQERERAARIAEADVESEHGARCQEARVVMETLTARRLRLHRMLPDGHCLFAALAHQLGATSGYDVAKLRASSASYMREHAEEFRPFLVDPASGDVYSNERFERYCEELSHTAVWGGQLEICALSHVLKRSIEILQATGPPITIGEEYGAHEGLVLVLLHHELGLGRHYDSVQPMREGQEDDVDVDVEVEVDRCDGHS